MNARVRSLRSLAAPPALLRTVAAAFCGGLLFGCSTPHDYSTYLDHMPRSILVLPPLNESPEVTATYSALSTITRPLAERGYYVFPVAVVDAFLRENGLPTPGEMHQVPPQKLNEAFGADAILYLKVRQWGTRYQVVNSATEVYVEGVLVDMETGTVLWASVARSVRNSSSGGGGIIGALVGAVVTQVVATASDLAHGISAEAYTSMMYNDHHGMLYGAYHPGFEEDQLRRRQEAAELAAQSP